MNKAIFSNKFECIYNHFLIRHLHQKTKNWNELRSQNPKWNKEMKETDIEKE